MAFDVGALFNVIGTTVGGIGGLLNPREKAKKVRHAAREGVKTEEEFEQYLENKYGERAKEKGMDVRQYLEDLQQRRRQKYGSGGKSQANRNDSSDSSIDSDG